MGKRESLRYHPVKGGGKQRQLHFFHLGQETTGFCSGWDKLSFKNFAQFILRFYGQQSLKNFALEAL